MNKSIGWLPAALLQLAGCSTTYEWGAYEPVVLRPTARTALGRDERARLGAQIVQAREKRRGRTIPPGAQAHVGWLYLQTGEKGEARRWLEAEKQSFPESAGLVDKLLEGCK